jgi:hypothetical protein
MYRTSLPVILLFDIDQIKQKRQLIVHLLSDEQRQIVTGRPK